MNIQGICIIKNIVNHLQGCQWMPVAVSSLDRSLVWFEVRLWQDANSRVNGAGFSADSGLAVYADVAKAWTSEGSFRKVWCSATVAQCTSVCHQFIISLSLQLKLKSMSTSAVLLLFSRWGPGLCQARSDISGRLPASLALRRARIILGLLGPMPLGSEVLDVCWISNDDRRLIKVIESDWCSLASDDLNWWFVFIVRILAWTHHFDCISQGYNDYRLTDPHEGYEIIHHWVTGCYGQATLESH